MSEKTTDTDEMTVTAGRCEGFLVVNCNIKAVYSGLALLEVDSGAKFGHVAFPVEDFNADVAEGDRVQMILLLRPDMEQESIVG